MIIVKWDSVDIDIVAYKVLVYIYPVLNIPYPAFILDNIVMLLF